jgi:hypothetical protein
MSNINIKRIWAWSFDNVKDEEVKQYMFSNYINEIEYHDSSYAASLRLWLNMTAERKTYFGSQLNIFEHGEK